MDFDAAIRLTEILLALAFVQQSVEHLYGPKAEQRLFLVRLILSILLLIGLSTQWICVVLFINGIFILKRFQGPYNGGSDRMSLLILSCLCLIHFMPTLYLKEFVFAYLALQVILSYWLSGFFKIINPEWWSGQVLKDLFCFSAFPASENLRSLADYPKILCLASWAVIVFELLFPLIVLSQEILVMGLFVSLVFHLANTYLLGFNRFLWVWLAAYPSLIWLQQYLMTNFSH